MRSSPVERALRVAALALAAGSVAAAGGFAARAAGAGDDTCEDAPGIARAEASLACPETVSSAPSSTEPEPAGTAPTPTDTTATTPAATTTAPLPAGPDRSKPPAAGSARTPAPATKSTASRSTTFGSGTPAGRPPTSETPRLSGGPYVFPVIGPASFGDTWGAARASVAWHHGVDIFAPLGTPLVAVADGVLFSVGWNRIGGRRLWLRDREGNYFYYAHLSGFSRLAVEGARVRAGTVIGFVGNTGDAVGTPPHLHFEIHPVSLLSLGYDGAVNPFPYVSSWRRFETVLDALGAVQAATSTAPAPGAVLLGYADISQATSLAAGSLEQALEDAHAAATALYTRELPRLMTSRAPVPPPHRAAAQIARALDAEVARGARHGSTVWDELAACESSGDWGANTGNGYTGGLQFLPQTWVSHGGQAFAPSAHLATREQQIAVAERVLASEGWAAWPACSAMLGLRLLGDE